MKNAKETDNAVHQLVNWADKIKRKTRKWENIVIMDDYEVTRKIVLDPVLCFS